MRVQIKRAARAVFVFDYFMGFHCMYFFCGGCSEPCDIGVYGKQYQNPRRWGWSVS